MRRSQPVKIRERGFRTKETNGAKALRQESACLFEEVERHVAKDAKTIQWGREESFQQMELDNWISTCKR